LVVVALALDLWPWGALFLWLAIALMIVATAYFGVGPNIFRKADGQLPCSTSFVLGPCLLGQYLSLRYYQTKCRTWDEIVPNLWIGRRLTNGEAREAINAGVRAVLDLSAEFSEAKPFRIINYRNISILDLTAPGLEQLREMATFISA